MRRNTTWAFAGNATYAACQWIVFVLLVKALPLADVGLFAYGIAVTGPVFVLANMRLRNLLATGAASPHDFADYLAARVLTTAAAVVGSLLIAAAGSAGLYPLAIVALIACAKACEAVSDICHGLFQRELDMRRAAIGLIVNGALSVALVAISLRLTRSLAMATGVYALASLAALWAWDLRRTGLNGFAADRTETLRAARRLLWTATPLGLSAGIGSVQQFLPRYAVAAYLGAPALAVFTALSYIPTLGNLIVNAVAQAALPILARDSSAGFRRHLTRLVAGGTALGLASVVGTAVAGRQLLSLVYHDEYAAHVNLLLWLMLGAAVSYAFVFLGTAATVRMRFGAQLLFSLGRLFVVAVLAAPLVGRYGMKGAAYALLAGAIVEGCAYGALTMRDLGAEREVRARMAPALAEGMHS
jgi:O-antigen/teichoic acid export membrane protein